MENFIKLKKICNILLLFINQFFIEGFAFNFKKIVLHKSEENNLEKNFYKSSNSLIAEKNENQLNNEEKEKRKYRILQMK